MLEAVHLTYYPIEPETTMSTRGQKRKDPDQYVTVEGIKQLFTSNKGSVLLFNLQNIDFEKTRIVYKHPNKGGEGHCICCIGFDENNLIFHDSNRSGNSCKKTLSFDVVRAGQASLEAAFKVGGETFKKAMQDHLHIQECFLLTKADVNEVHHVL